jgi:ribosomal protein S27E
MNKSNMDQYEVVQDRVSDTSQAMKGRDIYYKCETCEGVVHSQPMDNIGCDCGNVFVDIDYFRLSIKDYDKFVVLRLLNKAT